VAGVAAAQVAGLDSLRDGPAALVAISTCSRLPGRASQLPM
jgi:hypothetical protein